MNNSVFDPTVDPLFDDWLVQDALGSPSPSSPSPYIKHEEVEALPACSSSTSSPVYASAEPLTLSYPSPGLSSTSSSPISSTSSAVPSPEQQLQDLFGGLANNPLTAALAALMSAAAAQHQHPVQPSVKQQPVKQQQKKPSGTFTSTTTTSAATATATTPVATFKASNKRKRESSDPPLSPQDEAAIKRQKNTDAARRSRLKKVLKMEAMESRVSELEKVNSSLILRVAVLDSEKTGLRSKESSYEERIKMLESQLAQAHKALANRS